MITVKEMDETVWTFEDVATALYFITDNDRPMVITAETAGEEFALEVALSAWEQDRALQA